MHDKFQKIIAKFISNSIFEIQNGNTALGLNKAYHTQNALISYDNHVALYRSLINYFDSECIHISKYLASGQVCSIDQIEELQSKIIFLENCASQLTQLITQLNLEVSELVKKRDLLNLKSPCFMEFEHFSTSFEYHLYFLNSDFTKEFNNVTRFERLNLNKQFFTEMDEIYQSAYTPEQFIVKASTFLNLDTSCKLAICSFKSRYRGFVVYFNPSDKSSIEVFNQLSRKDPELIYKLEEPNTWVISSDYEFDNLALYECFDAWVDADWLTLYLNEKHFPVLPVINTSARTNHSSPTGLGSILNQLSKSIHLSKREILKALSDINRFWFITQLHVLGDEGFADISEAGMECFYNILLIKFFNGENEEFICYFDSENKSVMLHHHANTNEAEILLKTYLLSQALLSNVRVIEA